MIVAIFAAVMTACGQPSVKQQPNETSTGQGGSTSAGAASTDTASPDTASPDTASPGNTSPSGTEPSRTAAPNTSSPAGSPPGGSPANLATVGDTIELHGIEDGEKVAVTLVTFVDPAHGASELDEPSSGQRFVAAQFRLRNTGTATYDDSPSKGAVVVDSEGQRFDSTIADVSAGPSFASSTKVSPGDTAVGFIAFEVPGSAKIARVQFTLSSGLADQTGEWTVT